MNFLKIDYKGKHFILQDTKGELDFIVGGMLKEHALEEGFVAEHTMICRYYGIPPYIGEDEEMRKAFNSEHNRE